MTCCPNLLRSLGLTPVLLGRCWKSALSSQGREISLAETNIIPQSIPIQGLINSRGQNLPRLETTLMDHPAPALPLVERILALNVPCTDGRCHREHPLGTAEARVGLHSSALPSAQHCFFRLPSKALDPKGPPQ